MIAPLLEASLEPLARRRRRWQGWRILGGLWCCLAVGGLVLIGLFHGLGWWSPWAMGGLTVAAVVGGWLLWARSRHGEPNYRELAREIETRHPELHALLRTAVEQKSDPATGRLNYLQERVIAEAVARAQAHFWLDTISVGQMFRAQLFHLAALGLLGLVVWWFPKRSPAPSLVGGESRHVEVLPGDAAIERGYGVAVSARFEGFLPSEVSLVVSPDSQATRRIALAKNLDDPLFGGSIPEVTSDLIYHVAYDQEKTRDYRVTVFDYPRLERADVVITYPEYTGQSPKRIQDTRRISAVEGSVVDFALHLNKPVVSARLLGKDGQSVALLALTNQPAAALEQFRLATSQTYRVQLVDAEGRTNKVPAQLVVNVLENRSPELHLAFPRGDHQVSPLQEIRFQAEAWDDFGLREAGLTYTVAGTDPKSVVLSPAGGRNEKRSLDYLLRLEELGLKPDQLMTYYLWAEDLGPDGQIRRTSSDMYFAEVRPFDEIYREGQSGQGQEQGQDQNQPGNASEETARLVELQKQIINATWKLQRQANRAGAQPSAQYLKDAPVVLESQKTALDQARSMKPRAQDAEAAGLIEQVEREMEQAVSQLTAATQSAEPLPLALAAEQSAYQALLKLQAHEYDVSRSRNRNQARAGSRGQRDRQQLDQLDLKQSENRYETARQATPPQSTEQREQLQVLNRLKELAQRQHDLKERLQELQTALQQARSEEEQAEIRRQLKRLREEQQQLLADVDELRDRMTRPENQSRMSDAREQLDQTRSEVQRAAEALENEAVSQALASTTRAERDLQQLRDDFRKQNSSQFSEDMRTMRSAARQLAQRQEDIASQVQELARTRQKSLTTRDQPREVVEQLAQQRQSLTNLLQDMTRVTQDAEASEPLLARQLYEAVRQTSQGELDNALALAGELLKRNFANESRPFAEQARRETQDLKSAVERAAQSVLGDDLAALRLAQKELQDLSAQVENEMAQAQAEEQNPSSTNRLMAALASSGPETNSPAQRTDPSQRPGQPARPGSDPASAEQTAASQDNTGQTSGTASAEADAPRESSNQPGSASREQQGETARNGRGASERAGEPTSSRRFFERGPENGSIGTGPSSGPLTGPEYGPWSDRLRDVEEMLEDPHLRQEAAVIRDRARNMRIEYKRHGREPQWDLVKAQITEPMAQLRDKIVEELTRRESPEALVPIDRDPVPHKFSELVRRYYERLGGNGAK